MPELTLVFKRNLYSSIPRLLFRKTILAQIQYQAFGPQRLFGTDSLAYNNVGLSFGMPTYKAWR
jgi:hypothetical protein